MLLDQFANYFESDFHQYDLLKVSYLLNFVAMYAQYIKARAKVLKTIELLVSFPLYVLRFFSCISVKDELICGANWTNFNLLQGFLISR